MVNLTRAFPKVALLLRRCADGAPLRCRYLTVIFAGSSRCRDLSRPTPPLSLAPQLFANTAAHRFDKLQPLTAVIEHAGRVNREYSLRFRCK